jgi:hypothetical protein
MKLKIVLKDKSVFEFEATEQSKIYDVAENGLVTFTKECPDPRGGGKIKLKLFACQILEILYYRYES